MSVKETGNLLIPSSVQGFSYYFPPFDVVAIVFF